MFSGTFTEIAEVASKTYDKQARNELERQMNELIGAASVDKVKKLGLPQVLMFFSSSIAKNKDHKSLEPIDVQEAAALLRYLLSRDFTNPIIAAGKINLGLPQSEVLAGRLEKLLRVSGNMRTKHHLDGKVERLTAFLQEHKLKTKHIKRLEVEIRATTLLLARAFALIRPRSKMVIKTEDIDVGYDFVRFMIFKVDVHQIKILKKLYTISNKNIWKKIPKLTFDQSAHDHLSETAYSFWEEQLPATFEVLKKKINCSSRPFIGAIFGYSEIYSALNKLTRIGSQELLYILEKFEQVVFGTISPLIVDNYGINLQFSMDAIELLGHISDWLTSTVVYSFGKDEYLFSYGSTIPRQMSFLLFVAIIEKIKEKAEKITTKHIYAAMIKWSDQLELISILPPN